MNTPAIGHDVPADAAPGKIRDRDREDELMRQLAERARTQRLQQQRIRQIPTPAAAGLPALPYTSGLLHAPGAAGPRGTPPHYLPRGPADCSAGSLLCRPRGQTLT
jgi:hypothetical protein